MLQLTNLHGDIIATAYLSETATALASTADTSEYGVPTVTAPAKYSWLGASEIPTELPSGVIDMGARSYVPQLGPLPATRPHPGGSANAYAYTFGDPVNSSDPTGAYVEGDIFSGYTSTQHRLAVEAENARIAAREAAEREAAARAAAEQAAREAAAAAAVAGPQYAGEEEYFEEYEEWYEEEGGYEYASDQSGGKPGQEEAHVEPAVLYRPLGQESEGLSLGGEWSRIFAEYGSRCEQYGGHWVGHTCHLGRHSRGGSTPESRCRTYSAVTSLPLMWTPAGWVALVVGQVGCSIT